MLRMLSRWFGGNEMPDSNARADLPPMKWLPAIDTDACTGCGQCVEACEHGCLSMEWSFATLLRPGNCGSEGRCMEACPHGVIRMGWVEATGDDRVGVWRDSEEEGSGVSPRR